MGMSNEQIVKRMIESKAIDFNALGNLVAELGPELAVSNHGYRLTLVGRPSIIACLMPASDIRELVGELPNIGARSAISGE